MPRQEVLKRLQGGGGGDGGGGGGEGAIVCVVAGGGGGGGPFLDKMWAASKKQAWAKGRHRTKEKRRLQ